MAEYPRDVKSAACDMYCEGKSLEQISSELGPAIRTLRRWARDDDWDTERERVRTTPLRLDHSFLVALAMEERGLKSPDDDQRRKSIEMCYKIAATRNRLSTNQVDKGPIAIQLAASFRDYVKRTINNVVPVELRATVSELLVKFMIGWFEEFSKGSKEDFR